MFQINRQAHKLSAVEVKNKLKTLTQGQYSEAVLGWMANTFAALATLSDFENSNKPVVEKPKHETEVHPKPPASKPESGEHKRINISGLQYVINIQLPESRDQAVYDALFKSMREHLEGA